MNSAVNFLSCYWQNMTEFNMKFKAHNQFLKTVQKCQQRSGDVTYPRELTQGIAETKFNTF